jgi:hypothetical protein
MLQRLRVVNLFLWAVWGGKQPAPQVKPQQGSDVIMTSFFSHSCKVASCTIGGKQVNIILVCGFRVYMHTQSRPLDRSGRLIRKPWKMWDTCTEARSGQLIIKTHGKCGDRVHRSYFIWSSGWMCCQHALSAACVVVETWSPKVTTEANRTDVHAGETKEIDE